MVAPAIRHRGSLSSVGGGHRGLTLVAGLLTVFLLGLLAALILVTVWTARGAADRATCTSQLRELASALAMYKAKSGDYPPSSYQVRDSEGELLQRVTWQQILASYVDDAEVFLCPRDVLGGAAADGKTAGAQARIYCSYDYVAQQQPEGAGPDGPRAAGSPRPGQRGRQTAAGTALLLYCKHHDEGRRETRRWVLAAYDDGSVKWEPAPSFLLRRREGDSTETESAPRPGGNDE